MIGHSTKRKRRQKRVQIAFVKMVMIYLCDPRFDFWVVSVPCSLSFSQYNHYKVYGKDNAQRKHRQLVSELMRNPPHPDHAWRFKYQG